MAINRRLAVHIILTAVALTIAGLAVISWMDSLTIDSLGHHQVALYVTNAQFDNDLMNITVRNVGVKSTIISSVIINQTSTLHTVPVHEPISPAELITIRIAFKWTSGCTYQIKLETTDNLDYNYCNTFSAIAP
jgi:hypothetical protein